MNLGLRAKLIASIASFMVVLAAFIILYFPWRQERVAEKLLEARAIDTATALAATIARDVKDRNKDSVTRRINAFGDASGRETDIRYIRITLADGSPYFIWLADADLKDADLQPLEAGQTFAIRESNNQVHVSLTIVDGGVVGVLHLGISQDPVAQALSNSRLEALVLGGVILIIGLLVALLVGRSLTTPILEVARELADVSNELASAARDQEASSAEEAAAVAETRRALETLLDSAQKIAERSSEVLGNAERSTNGSRQIASRIGGLNVLSERIAEILGSIMQVADKADLLALNASLEGTRAGDAGKGFALVGAEMRRLAENVIESVSGIRALMAEMRELSQAAASASQEGTNSSTATRHSAQEIAMLTQDQRKATEQVIASMDELGSILNLTLDGIQRTSESAGKLTSLASSLSSVVKNENTTYDEGSEPSDFGEETIV